MNSNGNPASPAIPHRWTNITNGTMLVNQLHHLQHQHQNHLGQHDSQHGQTAVCAQGWQTQESTEIPCMISMLVHVVVVFFHQGGILVVGLSRLKIYQT